MKHPLPPAAIPAAAWSDLAQLPGLREDRQNLHERILHGCPQSARTMARRRRLAEITREIITREVRLAGLGIDPMRGPSLPEPERPFTETEH